MTLARERDQWFWVASGAKAVRMARDCAARARQEGRPDLVAYWMRKVDRCTTYPAWVLKIKLPQEYVERRINQPRYSQEIWWKGL